nr:glycosyltransferase family 2 protein [Hyunsoonleella ulvae]
MPIFNRAHLIEETIISIKNQTYGNWECVIIDDGSTDNTFMKTQSLIDKDSRFHLYKRPENITKGPSACRNFAITKIKGEYIQFFDSDDIMHPNHLELKIAAIKNNDLTVCKLQSFKGKFKEEQFLKEDKEELIKSENIFEDFVTGKFPMMMVAPLWRVSSLKPHLPIREDLHILEDHELYARALFKTKKVALVNKTLIFYRVGETSSTNSFYRNVTYGLHSFLEAKRTVLKLSQAKKVKLAILKMTLGVFRQALAERNFKASKECLHFIDTEHLCYSKKLKLKYFRVKFFYKLFKLIKRGDTKFKPLFKI